MKTANAIAFLVVVALMLILPFLARAEQPYWADRAFQTHRQYRDYPHWRRPQRYRPPVYGWRHRHIPHVPAGEPDKHCKAVISVVGDQRPTVDGAKEQADKAWRQEVRFRYGEFYTMKDQAKNLRYACSQSSIAEVLNQTMMRCQIIAQPCPAEVIWSNAK